MTEQPKYSDRRDRETERRRRDILLAASDLFVEKGYPGTTMQDIADAAEFSVGYLYKQFQGKQDILSALMERTLDYLQAIYRELGADHELTPLQKMRENGRRVCRYLSGTWNLTAVLIQNEPGIADVVGQRIRRLREHDVALIEAAQRAGELPPVDARTLAVAIKGLFWHLIRAISQGEIDLDYERISDVVDDLLIEPLAARCSASRTRKDDIAS